MKIPTVGRWGATALMVGTLAACGGGGGGSATPATPATPTTPTSIVTPPTAEAVALAATVGGETCATCHAGSAPIARSGPGHQTEYDKLYQGGVIKVTNMTIASNGTDTTTLKFTLSSTKAGVNLDCSSTASTFTIGSYYDPYDAASKTFTYAGSGMSLKPTTSGSSANGTISYDGAGGCTMVKTFTSATDKAYVAAITTADGIVAVYGADGILESIPAAHMNKAQYPFAGVLRLGATMGAATAPYVSAANVSGCESCHTQPFYKHAYIAGTVDDNTPGAAPGTTQQFYVCKACHSDQRTGGDAFWQLLQEAKLARADAAANPTDTTKAAYAQALSDRAVAVNGGAALTAAEKTKYAYKTRLMNDVHMSHAMEFPYPQSMRNCVACHKGNMDATTGIFKPANFRAETCISCHSFDGITAKMKAAPYNHSAYVTDVTTLTGVNCTLCHDGTTASSFSQIHTGGYDPLIYASDGTRYSTNITASIDSASIDSSNVLDIKFSAAGSVGSLSASGITPTVMVGLYGYNTKDFIVTPHGRDADGNRLLEFAVDGKTTNPRFTTVSASAGAWEVKADLSPWKDMIADGTVKRLEIAVMPALKNADGNTVGLDAPSKTFDLATNKFVTYFSPIVNVMDTAVTTSSGYAATKGCNTCHDQLATTFHSGDRGGNIVVCRLCHVPSSGGSHLEMQSRSIDSYVHAIHSFQAFDIGNIDFSDTFEAMEYKSHTGTEFPRFGVGGAGTADCESCHVSGMYGVSDPSKSLPGLLSGSATLKGTTRNIGTIPAYVTGPATKACGACHRSEKINNDDAGGLVNDFNHWKQNGYLLEDVSTLWDATVAAVMSAFK